jgi:hypothetical protein
VVPSASSPVALLPQAKAWRDGVAVGVVAPDAAVGVVAPDEAELTAMAAAASPSARVPANARRVPDTE